MARRKRVAILGSTGSIGTQALDVIARHADRFEVIALAAGTRLEELAEQARRFTPQLVACARPDGADRLRAMLGAEARVAHGAEGLRAVAAESGADIVLAATDGAVAFEAVFAAVARGIDVAVANKELVVAAGELLFAAARTGGARILPVDSEHSAIFQCLVGEPVDRVATIVLTASGGPFWEFGAEALRHVSVADALRHPTWQMGPKNTIDSATLMNKGLEVIEASRFFGVGGEQIAVLVHRTSVAHGFVIFSDGNVKGQLAPPDMRLPIGYALAYPDRLPGDRPPDPLVALGGEIGGRALLAFEPADRRRFPCLGLAYEALRRGGTVPAVLSAANEIAVGAFLDGRLEFPGIAALVGAVVAEAGDAPLSLDSVRESDRWARERALGLLETRFPGSVPQKSDSFPPANALG